MPTCPSCGLNDPRVYHGATDVECPSSRCVHYAKDLIAGEETKPEIKVPAGSFNGTVARAIRLLYGNAPVPNPGNAPAPAASKQFAVGAVVMVTKDLVGGGAIVRRGALGVIAKVFPGMPAPSTASVVYEVHPLGAYAGFECAISEGDLAPAPRFRPGQRVTITNAGGIVWVIERLTGIPATPYKLGGVAMYMPDDDDLQAAP